MFQLRIYKQKLIQYLNWPILSFSFYFVCSAFDYDTENMNSEDIYSSLKGVTEAIQNFSVRSQEDMNEPVQKREGEEVGINVFRL